MTTILADARLGVMVADSRTTYGDRHFPSKKVIRIGDCLIGTAGSATDGDQFIEWLIEGKKGRPPKLMNFEGLILNKDGVYLVQGDCKMLRIERGFDAIGSGSHSALGAYMAGADPRKAVKIACEIDVMSGGRVQVFRLEA